MVALQEELDWACYRLYGLTDEELTFPIEELPPIQKGERAFEIALARRMAAGEATTTWFDGTARRRSPSCRITGRRATGSSSNGGWS
jgi:hypothetical protein